MFGGPALWPLLKSGFAAVTRGGLRGVLSAGWVIESPDGGGSSPPAPRPQQLVLC